MDADEIRIDTPRLRLRTPRAQDADRIAALVGDFEVSRTLARVPHPYGRGDADAFLASTADWPPQVKPMAVELPSDGLIGMLGFQYEPGVPWAEIGYWFGRPWWGRGLATEAVTGALAWAGGRWGRRVVLAGHFVDNPASGRVLEKAGFLYTGAVEERLSLARGGAVRTRMMVWLA